jgi:hypothetical protein
MTDTQEQPASVLYQHQLHPYMPCNVNMLHAAEQHAAGINQCIAVALTNGVGTMLCAYLFAALALVGFPWSGGTPTQYVQWLSQTFIQLVMLSVIMVGQKVLGHKQELQADEQFDTTQKTFHDMQQVMNHLDAQDAAIMQIAAHVETLLLAHAKDAGSGAAT